MQMIVALSHRNVNPIKHGGHFYFKLKFWRVTVPKEALPCCFNLLIQRFHAQLPTAVMSLQIYCKPSSQRRFIFLKNYVGHCLASLLSHLISEADVDQVDLASCKQIIVHVLQHLIKEGLIQTRSIHQVLL